VGSRPSLPDIVSVTNQEQVDEICRAARRDGRFAFDTEFVMEDRFEPEVCLIQIATEDGVALIDPFLRIDLAPVWALVGDEQVETVVHAGQEDLGLSVQHGGQAPRRVYDVQVAAGLAGYDYPLSLQKLVQATLHIRLHKAKTLTDWRRRPLSSSQISYGAEDVCHLLAVRRKLHERLEKRNRVDWAREEFARFEDLALYRRATEEKLIRLKGAGALNGRQLAIVHELLVWREALAERLNRPIRAVLKDHLLVEIARLELRSFREIRDLRGLNLADRDVRALGQVVEMALRMPSEQWPVPAPRQIETPREAALTALTTAVIRGYCLEHDIAYSLAASKRTIQELVRHFTKGRPSDRGEVELLNGWRGQTVGAILEDVLAGRRDVRIESVDGAPLVRVSK
jgi:ribonuclease D